MNLSKLLYEIDVNVSIFDKLQNLMCFAWFYVALHVLLMALNQKPI